MSGLRDIKRRIESVKSTQQITKAMKMVAAAKLRHAQNAIEAARPYSYKIQKVLHDLASFDHELNEPLLHSRPVKKVLFVVLSSDRGLCGGFNANIIKRAEKALQEQKDENPEAEISFSFIGKKAYGIFKNRDVKIYRYYDDVISDVSFEKAREIADELMESFTSGEFDEIRFIYNEFKSAIAQEVDDITYLPIRLPEGYDEEKPAFDFLYEPSKEVIFRKLLPRYFHTEVYRCLLESIASEHGARMSAMEAATNNAGDMIKSLSLAYNRARQAAITKEILEITSGAEALK